jgi:predicted kinase
VTMLAGLPGSGKDHWIQRNRQHWPVVSLDSVREETDTEPTDNQGTVAQLAMERCRVLLRSRQSFVFNATNLQRSTRARWLGLFSDYGARLEVVYLEPPLPTIMRQNEMRERNVSKNVIRRLADRVQPPTWQECHTLRLEG